MRRQTQANNIIQYMNSGEYKPSMQTSSCALLALLSTLPVQRPYLRATANSLDKVKRSLLLLGNMAARMSVNRPEEGEGKHHRWSGKQRRTWLHTAERLNSHSSTSAVLKLRRIYDAIITLPNQEINNGKKTFILWSALLLRALSMLSFEWKKLPHPVHFTWIHTGAVQKPWTQLSIVIWFVLQYRIDSLALCINMNGLRTSFF